MDYPAPERKPGEDEVLEITLDEETPEEPLAGEVLDISFDAEDDGAEAYPEVTPVQEQAALPGVTVPCVCSATRRGFELRFEEQEPGVFYAVEALPKSQVPAGVGADKGDGLNQIQGEFRLGPEYACPHCHNPQLSACEVCQTVLCGGGLTKSGGCLCPGCGAELTLTSEAARGARGAGGGKKKGLW